MTSEYQLRRSLIARIYGAIGPVVRVDKQNRTFEIREGLFGTKLADTYYILRGYSRR